MIKRTFALLAVSALVGCTPTQNISMLPAPTLDAPKMAPQPAPRPAPAVAVKPSQSTGNVPVGWIPSVAARKWKYIVIHHSATPAGGAAAFDKMHRAKGWDELGYHFVIGNGTDSADGAIEIGSRWAKQKYGAHCKTPDNRYNDFGIGICLVGNFDVDRPTPKQLQALARLTGYLMKTYDIPASQVIGHGQAKPTDCPGKNMSVAGIIRDATRIANSNEFAAPGAQASTPAGNLLVDVGN